MTLRVGRVAGLVVLTAALLGCSNQAVQIDTASSVEATPAAADAEVIQRNPLSPPGLQQTLTQVYRQLLQNRDGELYSGAVAGTRIEDLAIAVVTVDGEVYTVGADSVEFPLMSVSKPFTYAVAVEQHGVEAMLEKVGVNATGMPDNSMAGVVSRPRGLLSA